MLITIARIVILTSAATTINIDTFINQLDFAIVGNLKIHDFVHMTRNLTDNVWLKNNKIIIISYHLIVEKSIDFEIKCDEKLYIVQSKTWVAIKKISKQVNKLRLS